MLYKIAKSNKLNSFKNSTNMKKITFKLIFLIVSVLITTISYGQTNADNKSNNEISTTLKGDTLYSSDGQIYFVGQQLTVGEPSNKDGYFRSILSKKAAIVPSIWGQDKRYENSIENYVDSKKNREKLIQFLKSVKSLTIKKILKSKTGKPYFYMVILSSDTEECKADIQLAIKLRELLLKP